MSIRRRSRKTTSGENRIAWQINHLDRGGNPQQKEFRTRRESDDERIRVEGQIAHRAHVHNRHSTQNGEIKRINRTLK